MLADVKKFMNHELENMNHELENMNLDLIRLGWGPETKDRDDILLEQICDHFNKRLEMEPLSREDTEWHLIMQIQNDIINALKNRDYDYLHDNLKNIFSSTITHGTTQGKAHTESLKTIDEKTLKLEHGLYVYDKLLDVMESVGLITMHSPEQYVWIKTYDNLLVDPDVHLERLMNHFNLDLTPPKNQGMLFGIDTKFGVYSIKDMHAIGLALMMYQKFKDQKQISICEIGAGVGQFAYYMNKIGFENYTIVDLPTISVSQMYFLGSNIGRDKVKFLSSIEFDGKYDVVINVDSMPEMAEQSAIEYVDKISKNTKYFLSVNQERRDFTVHDLCQGKMFQLSRNPFWFRKGYVIEEYMKL